jgi:hypothetical protein
LKNKNSQPFFFFVFQNRECQSRLIRNKKIIFLSQRNGPFTFLFFFLHFPPEAPTVSTQFLVYTMATPALKGSARKGATKTTGDSPMSPTPTPMIHQHFPPNKHRKWLLQYQQLFQFYLVHGRTNVTRLNTDNSLAEWASHQRSKMGIVDKYDTKWKQLLNGIGFCCSLPPTPTRCLIIMWCPTMFSVELGMHLRPRKLTTRPSVAGGNIGDNRVNKFAGGGQQNQKPGLAENI